MFDNWFITISLPAGILLSLLYDKLFKRYCLKHYDKDYICNPPLCHIGVITSYGHYVGVSFHGKDHSTVIDVIYNLCRRDFIAIPEADELYNQARELYTYI